MDMVGGIPTLFNKGGYDEILLVVQISILTIGFPFQQYWKHNNGNPMVSIWLVYG